MCIDGMKNRPDNHTGWQGVKHQFTYLLYWDEEAGYVQCVHQKAGLLGTNVLTITLLSFQTLVSTSFWL